MADNVTVTNKKTTFNADTNPDIPVATKDIGGYQYQKVLLYDATGAALVQTYVDGVNYLPTGFYDPINTVWSPLMGDANSGGAYTIVRGEGASGGYPAITQRTNYQQAADSGLVTRPILRCDEDTGTGAFPNAGLQLAAQDQAYGTYEPIYGFGNALQAYITNTLQTVADAGGGASGTLSTVGNTVSAGPDSTHGVSQFQIYGTYSAATVTFEYTIDGSTWTAFPVRRVSTGAVATTFTGTNAHEIFLGVSGASRTTRIRLTAITSGSITAGVRQISLSFDPVPAVYQAGTWTVTPTQLTSGTSTTSSVAGSASSVQLLASNSSRKSATIFNDSAATLYVKFGTTASTTDFKYYLGARDTLELPQPIYTGRIDGIWSAASGNARIAEET